MQLFKIKSGVFIALFSFFAASQSVTPSLADWEHKTLRSSVDGSLIYEKLIGRGAFNTSFEIRCNGNLLFLDYEIPSLGHRRIQELYDAKTSILFGWSFDARTMKNIPARINIMVLNDTLNFSAEATITPKILDELLENQGEITMYDLTWDETDGARIFVENTNYPEALASFRTKCAPAN